MKVHYQKAGERPATSQKNIHMKLLIIPPVILLIAIIIFLFCLHWMAGIFGLASIWLGWQLACEVCRD